MAQKTFVAGDVLTASDVNTYLSGEGGAWTSWTPAITQSGAVTSTNTYSRYGRWGRMIVGTFNVTTTGTGTGANAVAITLPATAAATGAPIIGRAAIYDTSVGYWYTGTLYLSTASSVLIAADKQAAGFNNYLGVIEFTAALANGDQIVGQFMYEAAS